MREKILYLEPQHEPRHYPDLRPDEDADAIIAAHDSAPSLHRRRMIRGLVAELKAANLWEKTDLLYIDDAHDPQAASLNYRHPNDFRKVAHGTAASEWKQDRGVAGDGISYFQDTNWSPARDGVNFARDNFCIAIESASNKASHAYDVGAGDQLRMNIRNANHRISINANSDIATDAQHCDSAIGTFFFGRSDAERQYTAIDQGEAVFNSAASCAVPDGTLKIFGNISDTYSTVRIKKLWAGASLGDAERSKLAAIFSKWSGDVGSRVGRFTTEPPIISRDLAKYGTMSSQQILSHERFGTRMIRVNYGVSNAPLGTSGERVPCHVRVSASDDGGATVTHGFCILSKAARGAILDPHVCRLSDGRALVVVPHKATTSAHKRSIFGVIIHNPMADPEKWKVTEPFFLDYGFVGRPRYKENGELRYTASDPVNRALPPYTPDQGNKYCELIPGENAYRSERLSIIPLSKEDGSNNSFFETSILDNGEHGVRVVFRGNDGIWTSTSVDEINWSTPEKMVWMDGHNVCSRVDMARSPSGRPVLIGHNSGHIRKAMTVYIGEIGSDGSSFPYKYQFDHRWPTGCTYPSVTFGRTSNGQYDGMIEVAMDRGRGVQNPPIYTNELIVTSFDEEGVINGSPICRSYIVID